MNIEVTETPAAEDLKVVGDNLTLFNAADVGPAGRRPLAVFVRDEQARVIAGISGYTAWGWLHVQWLWVDEVFRGRNIVARMLRDAEREAAARGCHGAYIDTFNPVALKSYQRAGYAPFGSLDDFPKGRTRTFLAKAL